MKAKAGWTRFATRHKVARMLLLGAVDLCLAVALSTGFLLVFGVFSNDKVDPRAAPTTSGTK